MERVIDEQGQLLDKFKPAVYLDSSVLIEYWSAYGLDPASDRLFEKMRYPLYWQIVTEIFQEDEKLQLLCEIRHRVENGQSNVSLIASPLAILELIEWFTYSVIKDIFAASLGVKRIERSLNKEKIRKILREIEARAKNEPRSLEEPGMLSEAMNLLAETLIDPTVARSHELYGVVIADIRGFAFTEGCAWDAAGELARFQVGAADILHVLVAHHLGCQYFASFDSDFRFSTVRKFLQEELKLELLSSFQELLDAVTQR